MTEIYNKNDFRERRKTLRNNAPQSERLIWSRLKSRKIGGLKFRRQYGIGPYVIDFYSPAIKLAIEIDGNSHEGSEAIEYDAVRSNYIESVGTTVVRFTNEQIRNDLEAVLEQIAAIAEKLPRVSGAD